MVFHRRRDDSLPPLYSTNYPLRIFVSLRAIVVGLIALFEVDSVNYTLLVAGEPPAAIITFALLIAFGLIGIFDAFINDVLPVRYFVRWMAEHRHLGFLALAAINVGFMFIVVSRGYQGTALLAYAIDALAAAWIAVYHVRHRYMAPRAAEKAWLERYSTH